MGGSSDKCETYAGYQIYLFRYAGKATRGFFTKEWMQLLYPTCSFVATAVAVLVYKGWDGVREHVLDFIVATVVGQFVGLPILFLLYRAIAPFRVYKKALRELRTSAERIAQLERESQASKTKDLRIQFNDGLKPYCDDGPCTDLPNVNGTQYRRLISVHNDHASETAERVSVELEDFKPNNWHIPLGAIFPLKDGGFPSLSATIDPGDGKFTQLLFYFDAGPNKDHIQLMFAGEGVRTVPFKDGVLYEMKIKVSGQHRKVIRAQFQFGAKDGRFFFKQTS